MGVRIETVRAKLGARLLDILKPGWASKIDLSRLDLGSCDACVLGQLFGNYSVGAEVVFAMRKEEGSCAVDTAAAECGFFLPYEGGVLGQRYRPLTDAWKRQIKQRQAV
jgi:hypothetical protein